MMESRCRTSEQKTWRYDLDTMTATPAALGPPDVSSFHRLAP
jgi:hypothetical protein